MDECHRENKPEDLVVEAFWNEPEVGGELILEYPVPCPPSRNRNIDGLIIRTREKLCRRPYTRTSLRNQDVWTVQAKSGELDVGVLGQAYFGTRLIELHDPTVRVTPVAAAVAPNPIVQKLADDLNPAIGLEFRVYPHLNTRKSKRSGRDVNPSGLQKWVLNHLVAFKAGLVVRPSRTRPGTKQFSNVRTPDCRFSISDLTPLALVLIDRPHGVASAEEHLKLDPAERVVIVNSCRDLYMTFLGRAVFGPELVCRYLGLRSVRSVAYHVRDNPKLRTLAENEAPGLCLARAFEKSSECEKSCLVGNWPSDWALRLVGRLDRAFDEHD